MGDGESDSGFAGLEAGTAGAGAAAGAGVGVGLGTPGAAGREGMFNGTVGAGRGAEGGTGAPGRAGAEGARGTVVAGADADGAPAGREAGADAGRTGATGAVGAAGAEGTTGRGAEGGTGAAGRGAEGGTGAMGRGAEGGTGAAGATGRTGAGGGGGVLIASVKSITANADFLYFAFFLFQCKRKTSTKVNFLATEGSLHSIYPRRCVKMSLNRHHAGFKRRLPCLAPGKEFTLYCAESGIPQRR